MITQRVNLSQNNPCEKLRFSGVLNLAPGNNSASHVSLSSVQMDEQILVLAEKLFQRKGESYPSTLSTTYRLPDDSILDFRYLENGFKFSVYTSAINDLDYSTSRLHPEFCLTIDTVDPIHKRRVEAIQTKLMNNLKISKPYPLTGQVLLTTELEINRLNRVV